ncbi:MAG: SMC-Scp complex subunit ScpB [Actinomyces ruminicola]|uniref:Segregation and condensation protein B n=1 Tax=Actinomyces ruminicola TaxID=332524 RepID=A0A1G9UHS7_9ACTO|nr:SMC-Scp complex subunit ScpB [Actinomyces ruminicola]MBE6482845.1 SMC-Scp complex subunit ScpB [Actinomyces ruminicola]SDM59481.1 segregation and condensation protein B [Actinomyces ruminicola]
MTTPDSAPARLPVPVPEEDLRAAVEAVLVVADEPVTAAALAAALDREETAVEAVLESLAAEYAGERPAEDGGAQADARARGIVLRRAAGGWRLASAPRFSELVERFVVGGATARLSQAALETLAVIAYRQPVTRGRIGAIRGVNVDGVVRTLHARGLIEETGTEPSGAILYRTTDEFLEYLGLDSLDDLPPLAPYLPDASALGDIEDEITGRILP